METKTSKHSGVHSSGKPQRAASGVTHTLEGILSIHPGTHPLDPFRSAKESREVNFSSLVYNAVNSSGRAAMPAAVGTGETMIVWVPRTSNGGFFLQMNVSACCSESRMVVENGGRLCKAPSAMPETWTAETWSLWAVVAPRAGR